MRSVGPKAWKKEREGVRQGYAGESRGKADVRKRSGRGRLRERSTYGGDIRGGGAGGMRGPQLGPTPGHTCMAACLAPLQRPSVGTGSPGRTTLLQECGEMQSRYGVRMWYTIVDTAM